MENTEPPTQKNPTGQMESNPRKMHAPGPWQYYWRLGDNGETDCGVFWEKRKGMAYSVCRAPRYETQAQWEANALLIAAAPELLEELRNIVNADLRGMRLDFGKNADRQFREWAQNRARAAIAKAEGAPSVQEGNVSV